jgi:hypothetical protein
VLPPAEVSVRVIQNHILNLPALNPVLLPELFEGLVVPPQLVDGRTHYES